jgi:hypothetical protein
MMSQPERHAAPGAWTQERWWAALAETAYILPIRDGDHRCYGIFAADGVPLAVASSRALAMAVIRCNAMQPVDAH